MRKAITCTYSTMRLIALAGSLGKPGSAARAGVDAVSGGSMGCPPLGARRSR